jgi:hypothetical protein
MLSRRHFCCAGVLIGTTATFDGSLAADSCAVQTRERQAALSPDDALAELKAGNERFLSHTIRTQSSNWVSSALTSRRRAAQGNDMTDLQAAVVNDDAVDDQLQESLPVLKRGIVQPDLNPLAERPQIGHHRLSLAPLVAQATLLLELKIQGMTLVGQLPAAVLQFLQADHFRLVSIQ